MAKYGDIKSDIEMTPGKSIRRKPDDTGFEAYTPGSTSGGTVWGDIGGTLAAQTDLAGELSGKTTLTAVKADVDIADAIAKKHSNTLDHSNALDHSNSLDHSNANDPSASEKLALAGSSGTPSGTNKFVTDADARNTNSRVPTTHSHAPGDVTGTAVITNDARLSDSRNPLSHSHAPGDVTGTAVINNDARLSDARVPTSHDNTKHSTAYAPVDAPTFTGVPAAPTPAARTSTTQIATTAFVLSESNVKCLLSNFTTSSQTAVSTNLTFPIGANEVFAVDVYGTCSKATSATGLKFAIGAPDGCVVKGFQLGGGATLAAALIPSLINAINTLGTTLATGIGIQVAFALHFRVVNGATTGNITIQCASVTSNTLTIYAGTKMLYNRASQI